MEYIELVETGGQVALLAEGVDRNADLGGKGINAGRSPSSRRAWIEIDMFIGSNDDPAVALLAEGVDRNAVLIQRHPSHLVALLAEGVDRNLALGVAVVDVGRRPPRGGRG